MRQEFASRKKGLTRTVKIGAKKYETAIADLSDQTGDARADWWQSFLRGAKVESEAKRAPLKIVDAFCGSGGLALGVRLAAEALNVPVEFVAAIDTDTVATQIHRHNLRSHRQIGASAASLVDFHVWGQREKSEFGYPPEIVDPNLSGVGKVDVLVAGPPCQGHSNLNNHTRRQDPRNDLYLTTAAMGVALGARVIIIENVPTVQNSYAEVVATAHSLLRSSGYGVSMAVLRADLLGAAQRRARHFMLAIKDTALDEGYLLTCSEALSAPPMPVSWAIGDLLDRQPEHLMDSAPSPTPVNLARINYLFDQDLYDLPNDQRPECHQDGTSYTAVYGRMHWDRPSQTITTGFGTPGQGRYVHPRLRRVITPREAARIQGFPDWYNFAPPEVPVKRKNLAKWIGDAVHPVLGYAVGLVAISSQL